MNIVVRTADELNLSRRASGFMGNLLNDSQISFDMLEEEDELTPMAINTTRRRAQLNNLSQVMGGMNVMNLSGAASPIIVETSIVMHGFTMKEEINPLEPSDVKLAFTSTKNLVIGILILLCFVISGAMVGPITVYLPAKSPLIKGCWRTQSNIIIGFPLMFMLYIWKKDELSFRRDTSLKMLTNSAITAFFGFIWYVGLIVGCSMTVTSHAMVMYSSTGVYMLVFSIIMGSLVHKFELYGYALFFLGVFLLFTDPYAVKIGGSGNQYIGDLITFLGAGAGAILGFYNSRNSKLIHPVVIMNHCLVFSSIFQITFASFMLGPSRVLSFDTEYGAFGWIADTDTFWFLVLIVAPFNGMTCNIAFYASYYYWPMEIIAGAILTEPFISQIVGVLMGQDGIPGFRTIFGLTIITLGTLVAGYGTRVKAVEIIEKI